MKWNNKVGKVRYKSSYEMLKMYLGLSTIDIYNLRKELIPYDTFIMEYLSEELMNLGETSEIKERVQLIFDIFDMGAQKIVSDKGKELAELIGIDTSDLDIEQPEEKEEETEEKEDKTEEDKEEDKNDEEVKEEEDNDKKYDYENPSGTGSAAIIPPFVNGDNDEFFAPLGEVLLSDEPINFGGTIIITESTEKEDGDTDGEDGESEPEDTGKIGWLDIPGWYDIEYDQDRFIFCWTNLLTALYVRLKFQYAYLFVDEYDGECCKCGAKGQTEYDYETWTSGVYPEDEMYDRSLYYRTNTAWGVTRVIKDVDCGCYRKRDNSDNDDF